MKITIHGSHTIQKADESLCTGDSAHRTHNALLPSAASYPLFL
jgi:hypothetical protein